ncbi:Uncharacterized protein HZ326_27250 [Fusarium oxysporum f. sp. albedinis]|nr:Uncharacterized protein HZ326_27250 [Fusarium oxysporum f. sp. albedinis]
MLHSSNLYRSALVIASGKAMLAPSRNSGKSCCCYSRYKPSDGPNSSWPINRTNCRSRLKQCRNPSKNKSSVSAITIFINFILSRPVETPVL